MEQVYCSYSTCLCFIDVVNGKWGEWGPWGSCSETEVCNRGSQVRTRQCNNPAPQNGGEVCPGTGSESQECPKTNCKGRKLIFSILADSWNNFHSYPSVQYHYIAKAIVHESNNITSNYENNYTFLISYYCLSYNVVT